MPVLVLSIICLVVSGALAFVNYETQPIILQAAAERAYQARKEIIPEADEFVLLEAEGMPRTVVEAYGTTNNVGFVFMVAVSGYGGEIDIMCGISPDGKIIKSTVLNHSETQGLGTIVFDRAVAYAGKDRNLEGVDTIAGSTITFNAYRRAMVYAFEAFDIVRGMR
jgi:electron transport complex protein RnfG